MDFDGAFAGGFHIGVQHQWNSFLLGVETSVLLTDLDGSSTCPNPAFSCSSEASWIWMIGPRVGFTANNWLFYGTGGYARGAVSSETVYVSNGVQFDATHERHDGWYAGGGIEWGLTPNVTLGIEYKHIELDSDLHRSIYYSTDNRNIDATIDTVQARLTLLLARERPAAPAPLKWPAAIKIPRMRFNASESHPFFLCVRD